MPSPVGRRWVAGQALVEMALVLPILLLLLMAVFDLGRAAYAQSTLTNAAGRGARVGIVDQSEADDCTTYPDVLRCVASKQATALGLDASAVAVAWRTTDLSGACSPIALGCMAQVTVSYTFVPITPFIDRITGTIVMSSTARLPVERVYSSAP